MTDLFDAPAIVPKHMRRCKGCEFYKGAASGKNAAGDCEEHQSPRTVTTPEATCDHWTVRK